MKEPKYTGNELQYLKNVLDFIPSSHGTWCLALEKEFAEMFGAKYAIAMNSGTATLHAALESLNVGYGDEVIVPALTVIMNTTTVWQCNAIPVYADIDPDTFLIDPEDIERKITSKTKAIVVVSLYGLPCDMDRINKISKKYNIPVIEDHAQCFLGKYNGEIVGVGNAFSSWSFENVKHMSSGEGGILLTNDENMATSARKLGGHGYKNLNASGGRIKFNNEYTVQDPGYKRHDKFGINYRLSEFQAAIALGQLEDLKEKVDQRIKVANLLIKEMEGCNFLRPQKVPENCYHSYYALGVCYEGLEKLGVTWQEFRNKYVELGGDSFYAAWSISYLEPVVANREYKDRCPAYKNLKYEKGLCPIAETIQPKLMQFKTNYRSLKEAKIKAESLRKTIQFYKEMK
jgi:perosamine synthetase